MQRALDSLRPGDYTQGSRLRESFVSHLPNVADHRIEKPVMVALEATHLKKSYDSVTAVDDLSFQVGEGEVYGLVGPNGAGKTTTMMMVTGMLKPDAGKIYLEGKLFDPRDRSMRSLLGIVPQDIALYPDMTSVQNLRFFGRRYGLRGSRLGARVRGSRLEARVNYILQLTGLQENADHRSATFSGGMKRRLNFGIALVHEPKFVVLDEPTVGIDPQSRSHLLDGVRELSRQGVGVIYATHYMEEVEAVCQRVAIMDRGRLLRQGPLDELLDRGSSNVRIQVPRSTPELTAEFRKIADVVDDPGGGLTLIIKNGDLQRQHASSLRHVLDLLDDAQIPLLAIETQEPSLEMLFLQLTGRSLRD
jgi:ABC-2 type transport system ATP-binding protein